METLENVEEERIGCGGNVVEKGLRVSAPGMFEMETVLSVAMMFRIVSRESEDPALRQKTEETLQGEDKAEKECNTLVGERTPM